MHSTMKFEFSNLVYNREKNQAKFIVIQHVWHHCKKITMMNGCMLPCQVCKKSILNISFSFLSFNQSWVDSMFFFCFHEVPGLFWGLKVHLIADSVFCVQSFFHQQVSLASWVKAPSRMVLRFDSSQYILVHGRASEGEAMECTICLCCAVKVTILTVTSAVTQMWQSCSWCHQVSQRPSVHVLLPR